MTSKRAPDVLVRTIRAKDVKVGDVIFRPARTWANVRSVPNRWFEVTRTALSSHGNFVFLYGDRLFNGHVQSELSLGPLDLVQIQEVLP